MYKNEYEEMNTSTTLAKESKVIKKKIILLLMYETKFSFVFISYTINMTDP